MDTHLCNKCQQVLIGLNNYITHRTSGECQDTTNTNCPPQGFTGGKWIPRRVIQTVVATQPLVNEPSTGNLESMIGSLYLRCCGVTLSSDIEVIRHKLSLTHRTSRIASKDETEHDLEVIEAKSIKLFPFICKSCKFYTSQMSAFVWHLNSSLHSEKNELFQVTCQMCSMVCRSISSFLKHFRREKSAFRDDTNCEGPLFVCDTAVTRFQCPSCPSRFKTRFGLTNHGRKSHPRGEELKPSSSSSSSKVVCDICKSEFGSKSTLRLHKKRHLPVSERPFKCPECDFAFCERKELVMHSKVHSDSKEFKCSKCHHRTRSIFTLRKHEKVHSSLKPFKCKLCPFECKLSSNLTRHVRIHSGSKPYSCPFTKCDFHTSNQENLRKHILKGKKHFGKSVYTCSECSFASNKYSEFCSHFKSTHTSIGSTFKNVPNSSMKVK